MVVTKHTRLGFKKPGPKKGSKWNWRKLCKKRFKQVHGKRKHMFMVKGKKGGLKFKISKKQL